MNNICDQEVQNVLMIFVDVKFKINIIDFINLDVFDEELLNNFLVCVSLVFMLVVEFEYGIVMMFFCVVIGSKNLKLIMVV